MEFSRVIRFTLQIAKSSITAILVLSLRQNDMPSDQKAPARTICQAIKKFYHFARMWTKRMTRSRWELITAILVLFSLGLITSLLSSLSICLHSRIPRLIFAVFLLLISVFLFIHSIFITDDLKRRGVFCASAVFALLSAATLFTEKEQFAADAAQLNIAMTFAFTTIAVSSLLSLSYRFATRFFFQRALLVHGIHDSDEDLLYFATNLLASFIAALVVSASAPENKKRAFDSVGFTYSIGVWFLNGILFAALGWRLARPSHDPISVYDSTPALVADAPGYSDLSSRPD
jgi:hypothetical protein